MLLVLPLNVQGAEECGLQYDPSAQHDAWHAEQAKQPVDFGYHTLCMSALLLIVLYTPTSCICAVRWGLTTLGPARMLEICMGQWSPYCMFTSGGRACLTRCCPPSSFSPFSACSSECG